MKKNAFMSLLEIIAVSILALLVVNFAWLINKQNKMCIQAILTDNRWSTKVDIVKTLNSKGEKKC